MESIFHRRWLQVVFDGRNQAYGAFRLRLSEERTVGMALLITLALSSGMLLLPRLFSTPVVIPEPPVCPDCQKTFDPTPNLPRFEPNTSAPVTPQSDTWVIVPKPSVDSTDINDTLDLSGSTLGPGNQNPGGGPIGTGQPGGSSIGKDTAGTSGKTPFGPWIAVPPEYPGGPEALEKDLRRLVEYPEDLRSRRIEGSVIVEFIVDENGFVTEPKILDGLGYGSEEAVLYAVRHLKQWRPGRHQGIPVPVRYVWPIKFALPD